MAKITKDTASKSSDAERDDSILISWIPKYAYCKRRLYLTAIEAYDAQNEYVAKGIADHMSVHSGKIQKRRDLIQVSGLRVFSEKHGMRGICDMVEFKITRDGAYVPFLNQKCEITPIEYKHGKKRDEREYNLQLCAQTICMEEMFGCSVEKGYVYYVKSKQRFEVAFDKNIRAEVLKICDEIHDFVSNPYIPEATYMRRCPKCSLYDICGPKNAMIGKYMNKLRSIVQ